MIGTPYYGHRIRKDSYVVNCNVIAVKVVAKNSDEGWPIITCFLRIDL